MEAAGAAVAEVAVAATMVAVLAGSMEEAQVAVGLPAVGRLMKSKIGRTLA